MTVTGTARDPNHGVPIAGGLSGAGATDLRRLVIANKEI